MSSRLRWDVYDSVAFDYLSAQEIRAAAGQDYLRPAEGIQASKGAFERKVPDEVVVRAFSFAGVLALAG